MTCEERLRELEAINEELRQSNARKDVVNAALRKQVEKLARKDQWLHPIDAIRKLLHLN